MGVGIRISLPFELGFGSKTGAERQELTAKQERGSNTGTARQENTVQQEPNSKQVRRKQRSRSGAATGTYHNEFNPNEKKRVWGFIWTAATSVCRFSAGKCFVLKSIGFHDLLTVLKEGKHLKMIIWSIQEIVHLMSDRTEWLLLTTLHFPL